MKEYVYALICPIDGCVRYVGKTKSLKSRYNQHIKKLDKQATPKRIWLEMLFSKKLLPKMEVLVAVDGDARTEEQRFLDKHKETAFNIHNPEKGAKSKKWK